MSRTPPPLPTFTFSNGVEISYRPVSRFFLSRLRLQIERRFAHERPEPPVIETDLGGPTPNPNDPEYLVEVGRYMERTGVRMFQAAIELSVQIDPEIVAAGLAEYEEQRGAYLAYLQRHGISEEPTPFDAFLEGADDPALRYVLLCGAAGDDGDLVRFMNTLYAFDTVSEVAVQSAQRNFPSDISGGGYLEAPSAEVGDRDRQSRAGVDTHGAMGELHD